MYQKCWIALKCIFNHGHLFNKLLERGLPLYIVRVIMFWYTKQLMFIRWGESLSGKFTVKNGVKQGGLLSPLLFNLYMDGLSNNLINCSIGCKLGGKSINHLAYADDICLFSPSSSGLQKMLNICESYGKSHDLVFNSKKSMVMFFH